jgi:hypothetical protein
MASLRKVKIVTVAGKKDVGAINVAIPRPANLPTLLYVMTPTRTAVEAANSLLPIPSVETTLANVIRRRNVPATPPFVPKIIAPQMVRHVETVSPVPAVNVPAGIRNAEHSWAV